MKNSLLFIILIISIPLLMLCNIVTGSVDFGSDLWETVVMKIRLPQAMTAMTCGAGLSVAGLQMQTIFRNPLAGPSVLGVSSAASLGVAIVLLLSGAIGGISLSRFGVIGNTAVTISAIAGAMSVMMLIVWLSKRVTGNATLLITGVMIGYIATAIIGVLKAYSTEEDIHAYVIWGLGSFSRVSGGQVNVFICITAVILPLCMLLAKPMNMMLLGELNALGLGLNVKRTRMLTITMAGTLTAVVTAYCGPIMFIGLAVPHIARGIFKTSDHRILLPATMLCGMALALVCNLVSKLPGANGVIPINSVTALIGAPVALYVLLKRKTDDDMSKIILITGGQRSGKSVYAEQLALSLSDNPVYMATAHIWDDDFRERVRIHQQRRGPQWTNIEEEKYLSKHDLTGRVILIDCLTLWATNFFFEGASVGPNVSEVSMEFQKESQCILDEMKKEFDKFTMQDSTFIFVTNEIGMGGTSSNAVQRRFTDLLGGLNQYVAAKAEEVTLMVSGIAVKIKH